MVVRDRLYFCWLGLFRRHYEAHQSRFKPIRFSLTRKCNRSATHYSDNNPLAVIDSEMPNIEQRLGYWKSGVALPLPSGACPRPRLIRMELWCN